jgi:primary-amine oxidase
MVQAYDSAHLSDALLDVPHPLEPLTAEEITAAVDIVRTEKQLSQFVRFASVTLHEPPKQIVLQYKPGDAYSREAELVLMDDEHRAVYEGVVSLTESKVTSWKQVLGVQPPVLMDEFFECEQVVKADPQYQEALRKRGITNVDLVMVDPWSPGYYGPDDDPKNRIIQALSWVRADEKDNGYAHPIEGLLAFVDMNARKVIRIEDYENVPLPSEAGNYTADAIGKFRDDLKPLEVVQPEGPSFSIKGHEIHWQKWSLRIGFTPREGLVLYTVGYEDQGRVRPILYRASLAEMVVPYGDPRPSRYRMNAFDVGEYGIGTMANSLELGCDCLGHIHYFDALFTDSRGNLLTMKNAICLHEEDYGILWKHVDWRSGHAEVRRSRRLVLSFIATVANYEYAYYWYFYQDGMIQFEVKMTGIMNTGAMQPGEKPKYGQLIAPQLNAPIHQHFFSLRFDMTVDGPNNSIYEVHTEAEPVGAENPYYNAFFSKSTLLTKESEAQQQIDPFSARHWKIVNPSVLNAVGEPVGYKLMPGDNVAPFAYPEASWLKRAAFATKHLWATSYSPDERHPAGDYPNQNPGGDGLPKWTKADRNLVDTDIVLWYTLGAHHVPRPEDWPVMPVAGYSVMLKPAGFFDRNPSLDVPPAPKHEHHC